LALNISMELAEIFSIAGDWEGAVTTIDAALGRFGDSEIPAVLELEAMQAGYRGYDPACVPEFEADLPRLLALVQGRVDDDSSWLRRMIAALGSIRNLPRSEILRLTAPATEDWSMVRNGRESLLMVSQGVGALINVDALDETQPIAQALCEEGQRRG